MIDIGSEREHYRYPDAGKVVMLSIVTKSPQKWLLIDRETGQIYEGNRSGAWDKLIAKETTEKE